MVDKLKEIEKRFLTVEGELSKPEVVNDMKKYTCLLYTSDAADE